MTHWLARRLADWLGLSKKIRTGWPGNDPQLDGQGRRGPHLDLPDNAVVVYVDEKSSIRR